MAIAVTAKGEPMTKKYIDLEVAIKTFEELPNCYNGFSDTYDKACIIGVLEELPAADVVDIGTVEAYGYKIKDLLMFAIVCRNAGVTDGDLRMFANYPSNIVRVVRCKDCKYRGDDICPMYFEEFREWDDDGYLEHDIDAYDYSKDDGYCYMGERRTDE